MLDFPEPQMPHELTASERQIAELLFAGLSLAAIARRRRRSRFTIMNQVQSIYRRLGVGSRAQLVRRLAGASPK